ncbi:hypothetical protein LSH36_523g00026 [Paralvinella palmiformis]|uniref:procollagen-proline 4-dioxygenase n=1 Tax=Paralvinella palmiformis TaxID=53620 RepID=A0AAD9MYT4_9ANNE|nr:hypothetical protein LSH36_523g00026 [Paralvinella palmiformis]
MSCLLSHCCNILIYQLVAGYKWSSRAVISWCYIYTWTGDMEVEIGFSTCLMVVFLLTGVHSELFSSITSLHRLMKQGEGHVLVAHHLAERRPEDGSTVLRLLSEVHSLYDKHPLSVEHPIITLNILKTFRVMATFTDEHFIKDIRDKGLDWPTDEDVSGAYHAIARLQKTYELPFDDVIGGSVAGIQSGFSLLEEDVVRIAEQALNMGYNATAMSWLDRKWTDTTCATCCQQLVNRLGTPSGGAVCSKEWRHGHISGSGLPKSGHRDKQSRYPEYEELCRKSLSNGHGSRKPLFCSYSSGRVPYVRYRHEFYSLDPLIVMFYDVVSEIESLFLKYVASHVLESGGIAIKGENRDISSFDNRVGHVGWVYDDWHPIISRISRRIADVTTLSTLSLAAATHAEPLQICNYGVGGHFRPHQDAFADDVTNIPEMAIGSGNRDATFMVYLSDVRVGGATVFPDLEVYVRPVKMAAVFWLNTWRSGRRDSRSVHGGCPVLVGDKWIANKWMWSIGQTFKRPCGLSENDTDISLYMSRD